MCKTLPGGHCFPATASLTSDGVLRNKRIVTPAHFLFAIGLAGLGVLSLVSGDFALNWQPVPAWVPWRQSLAYASGMLLLAGAIGMLVKRTASHCALAMTLYMLSWVVLLQIPRVAQAPGDIGMWLGFAESSWLFCGGWLIWDALAGPPGRLTMNRPRIARLLFGFACLILGLSHFVYVDATVGMVPAWLPERVGFAYLTGAGHFAAGLAILFGVIPRLAATLEASMIGVFVLLVHIPGVASAPGSRLQWTMLFVATALAGSALSVAESLERNPGAGPADPRKSGPPLPTELPPAAPVTGEPCTSRRQ